MAEDGVQQFPPDYIPPYEPSEVFRRYNFLAERCDRYLKSFENTHPEWRLRSDELLIISVAQSALDDIWRFKTYHLRDPEKLSDAVKRSAYFTKWIVRFRPIYFDRISSEIDLNVIFEENDTSLMANEAFAIHISLTTIATEIKVNSIHLEPDFFYGLLYDLHYREMSDDALLSLYSIIKNAAQKKSVILKVL